MSITTRIKPRFPFQGDFRNVSDMHAMLQKRANLILPFAKMFLGMCSRQFVQTGLMN